MKRIKIGRNEKDVLKIIGSLVELIGSVADPKTGMLWKSELYRQNRNYKRVLGKLVEKDLIILGGESIELSIRGKELVYKIQVEEIELIKDSWDGVWRVVVYDIPNVYTKERNYFRAILKRLEFLKIQKSMWVVPWECKEEIAVIAQSLSLSPYVVYLTTDHLPKQSEYVKKFGIK